MINRILWDVGNVIVLADHVITHARLVEYGLPVKQAKRFYATPAYADFARGKLNSFEFCDATNAAMEAELPIELMQEAHDVHMWGVDDEVVFLMRRVNRPIVFATDVNEWQLRRERELIDLTKFSNIFFRSNELGLLKRDPGCFAKIVATLGDDPATLVLIDDSLEKVVRAQSLGLETIHFINADQLAAELMKRKLVS